MNCKQHIPNILTCCNLISGCMATTAALYHNMQLALIFIICGAAFDFCDGMVARLLCVSSPIGKELDSLADVVTFGVAPSSMLVMFMGSMLCPLWMTDYMVWLKFIGFVMAAFSALRLAKFNVDTRQTTSFIGLPTPANALFWGSLIVGQGRWLLSIPDGFMFLVLLEFLFCYLLVAELPLFALKFKNLSWQDNWIKYVFLIGALPCFLLGWSCFAAIVVWYLVLSLVARFVRHE